LTLPAMSMDKGSAPRSMAACCSSFENKGSCTEAHRRENGRGPYSCTSRKLFPGLPRERQSDRAGGACLVKSGEYVPGGTGSSVVVARGGASLMNTTSPGNWDCPAVGDPAPVAFRAVGGGVNPWWKVPGLHSAGRRARLMTKIHRVRQKTELRRARREGEQRGSAGCVVRCDKVFRS